jgi:redox-sensitive bicupin YhaK (pirin superfamily)
MLEVRRSRDRGYADHGWLKTYYTFSFADYYDPEHIDFGPLQVMNEDRVKPGKGYATQSSRDVEILTYVIDGELQHKDSLGNGSVIRAGSLQCISAGTGVTHTEFNPSETREAHFLHICVKPSQEGIVPAYEQKHFPPAQKSGMLRLIASPDGEQGSVVVHQDARLYGGLFHQAQRADFELKKNRRAFVHVMRGSIAVNETRLNAGDGVKITQAGDVVLQHGRDADVIVIDLPAGAAAPKRKSAAKKSPSTAESQ